jgi:hypothetical protein
MHFIGAISARAFEARRVRQAGFVLFIGIVSGCATVSRPPVTPRAAFSSGAETARRFGVHEITLLARDGAPDPSAVLAEVTFVPPSGEANARTVAVFHDGGRTYRARVYVAETGAWRWRSRCAQDAGLDGHTGVFAAEPSHLRGRLLPHPKNPRHWITEDGRFFVNLNDTAYRLFAESDVNRRSISDDDFKAYVQDASAMGITSLRASLLGPPDGMKTWEDFFAAVLPDPSNPRNHDRYVESMRRTDRRLRWMLEHFPDLYVQAIMLPRVGPYAKDDPLWSERPEADRLRVLRTLVARYAAFPQIFWLVSNDAHHGPAFPRNTEILREVATHLAEHDPWQHPRSAGPARRLAYPTPEAPWLTYLHIEDEHDLSAAKVEQYFAVGKPIFLGEDRYEQDHGPVRDPLHMRYWQRRLFWSWLIAGGSTNYGGRYMVLHPYKETKTRTVSYLGWKGIVYFSTPLEGLDSVPFIRRFFEESKIDLALFVPDHGLASDTTPRAGDRDPIDAPRLARRDREEFVAYHPNARGKNATAEADPDRTARLRVDLSLATGTFRPAWYRALDGALQEGPSVNAGAPVEIESPFRGADVVLWLRR